MIGNCEVFRGVFRGGAKGAKTPLDQWNLLISGGLRLSPQPLEREKNLSPPEQIPEYAPEGFNIQLNLL